MDEDFPIPVIKPLVLMGGQSPRMKTRKEPLPFLDGRLAFKHALETLRSAFPTASEIYISLHSTSQLEAIKFRINDPFPELKNAPPSSRDHPSIIPSLIPIFDHDETKDIGFAATLLSAYSIDPNANWLVMICDYPFLPPTALQQLILEFQDPVTCFVYEDGFVQPLIGIWAPEALRTLKEKVEKGRCGLGDMVKEIGGKTVSPLREEWIREANTRQEWVEMGASMKGEEK